MANLARVAVSAREKASAGDDARAEARAAGEENRIRASPARSPTPFGEGTGVGVVDHGDRTLEVGFKPRNQFRTFPAGKIRRSQEPAARGIERSATGNPDAREIATETLRRFGDEAACLPGRGGAKLRAGYHLAGCGAENDGGLGAAEIDAEEVEMVHLYRPSS